MNSGKEAVLKYAQKVAEIEVEKEKLKQELIAATKSFSQEEDFIYWYYWETDNPTDILKEITGRTKFSSVKIFCKPKNIPYICPKCKKTAYYSCGIRSDVIDFNKRFKKNKNLFICHDCLRKSSDQKQAKANEKHNALVKKRKEMPYAEYLQTSYWKKFSRERMEVAKYQCSKCKNTDVTLNVHHLTYERRGEELNSDVMVLCEICHLKIHGREVPKEILMKSMSLLEKAKMMLNK